MIKNVKAAEQNTKVKASEDVNKGNLVQKFTVQTNPKDSFKLFVKEEETTDSYIWDKKFFNTLPKLVVPPKSFNFSLSHEALCNFNMPTMMFSLKQFPILTDSKMNTSMNKDLIEKSINYIFPDADIYNTEPQRSTNDPQFKKDILNIIHAREDQPVFTKPTFQNSMYSRQVKMMSSTVNIGKKYMVPLKPANVKDGVDGAAKNATINVVADINKSFTDIRKIEEGSIHPTKPKVTATEVYDILPFYPYLNHKLAQIFFPSESGISDDNKNEDLLLKLQDQKNVDEKIFACYKCDHEIEDTEKQFFVKREYEYKRDFSYKLATSNDIFNTCFMFLDKETKKAFYVPVNKKFLLKKFKKLEEKEEKDFDGDDKLSNRKRKRPVYVYPRNKNQEQIKVRNEYLKHLRVKMEYTNNEDEFNRKQEEFDQNSNYQIANDNDDDEGSSILFPGPEEIGESEEKDNKQEEGGDEDVAGLFEDEGNF